MAILSREEHYNACLDRLLFLFWAHYMRMVLIYYAQVRFRWTILQITKEKMLLITTKKKDICKCKGKSG